MRVLIADDHDLLRDTLVLFLESQGDIVVLGLNSDSSVKEIKGKDRPINNQHDRAAILSALETLDYIVIFDDPSDPAVLDLQILSGP